MLLTLRLAMNFGLRLHLTLLPQTSGRRHRRRLASPLHGTLTPARISRSRPPLSRTGVSLSLTESLRYSLPQAVFRTDGNRWAPYLGQSLIEAVGEKCSPLPVSPASTGGLRASSGVARLFSGKAPSGMYLRLRVFCFQGSLIAFTDILLLEQIV